MKQPAQEFQVLETVTDYTRFYELPAPAHPLLTLIDLQPSGGAGPAASRPEVLGPVVPGLYTVFLKRNLNGPLYYGHHTYDFREGVMGFSAPGQVFRVARELDTSRLSGWMLVFHPDLLRHHPLARKIASYGFFAYDVHEALHLSASEEALLDTLLLGLRQEYERPIDAFSQDVLVAQLEVLLHYANRFYHRQFLTRRTAGHDLLQRFEALLAAYFTPGAARPLPTVRYFADELHVSVAYLSDLLRTLTHQNAQQHIHHALIERAKHLLLSTNLTISETAFQLGFEYPQYFSRLFKRKTGRSPAAFRTEGWFQ
ncbi:helix-turn-helix domain-containing protein [Hymenobacter psychrophilus]|uniref:Helix-turn-helix domain-containing protein n=1 Tax=Hymenobacter psychrophilus TaxID=651662 RepID=A0A1H3DER8_9BACT|nr:helix-turn-helix transcriptional regulator [Hymenobacter psychrophilus]SDX64184.1 Helix-turn-helix domain-containing protein [Hymenobacter psychrophilus]